MNHPRMMDYKDLQINKKYHQVFPLQDNTDIITFDLLYYKFFTTPQICTEEISIAAVYTMVTDFGVTSFQVQYTLNNSIINLTCATKSTSIPEHNYNGKQKLFGYLAWYNCYFVKVKQQI